MTPLCRFVLTLVLAWPALAASPVVYTNFTRGGPVQIHLVKFPRHDSTLEIRSVHSGGKPVGRAPLSAQLRGIDAPVAAINADFFQLDGVFAGDPRGLQIADGALVSAPAGSATFWIDSAGQPHINLTRSGLRITWPDGTTVPIGLNGQCDADELELYTSDLSLSKRGGAGREIKLVPTSNESNGVLRAGKEYALSVAEIRAASDQPIRPGTFLLAVGSTAASKVPTIQTGAVVKVSTGTRPNLAGVRSAVSGGPILAGSGKQHRFDKAESQAYAHRHVLERHPRSALGWNAREYFWVEVDGRRKESIGMTLNELAALMVELGCEEAMNLDGGGSSTLWFDGQVRNKPSDGAERPIANALVLVRKPAPTK